MFDDVCDAFSQGELWFVAQELFGFFDVSEPASDVWWSRGCVDVFDFGLVHQFFYDSCHSVYADFFACSYVENVGWRARFYTEDIWSKNNRNFVNKQLTKR
jgi:hypothetical protein